MAVIVVDNFSYQDGVLNIARLIRFDTVTRRFTVLILTSGNATNYQNQVLNYTTRGNKNDNQFLNYYCEGFNKFNFYTSYYSPYATFIEEVNSVACGFAQAPIPPPLAPVSCDLAVTAIATHQTKLNANDGTITATISQTLNGSVQVGLFLVGTVTPIKSIVLAFPIVSFTFDGLLPNDYYLNAFDVDTNCLSPDFNISVLALAFKEKYYFDFCEKRFGERPIKVSIKTKNFAGTTTNIEVAGSDVLILDYPGTSQDKFEPILGSSAESEFMTFTEFQYADLLIAEEKTHLMEVYLAGVLYWTGYLVSDRAQEPFKNTPYPVRLSAFDGIKLLNDIDFDQSNNMMTFLEVIKYCLDKTELVLPFKTMVDIVNNIYNQNGVLNGFEPSIFGNTVNLKIGNYKINNVSFNSLSDYDFNIPPLEILKFDKQYYVYGISNLLVMTTNSRLPVDTVLIATITRNKQGISVVLSPYLVSNDVIYSHKIQTNRFLKENGDYTDCLTVLEYIAKQFTAQIKQSGGYWVIENIGAKARGNTTENTYLNDLTFVSSIVVNLSKDVACTQQESKVLGGGNLSLIPGNKKSIVRWNLGYPQPIILNGDFEQWIDNGGKLIPNIWQLSTPYDWFERGSKFDRTFDPTTGNLTLVENGTYYLNVKNKFGNYNHLPSFQSAPITVFNQEVINLSFQVIPTNMTQDTLRINLGLILKIGTFICANNEIGKGSFEPIWVQDNGKYSFSVLLDIEKGVNDNRVGDQANINLSLPPSPSQGRFTTKFDSGRTTTIIAGSGAAGIFGTDLGFDNFKITKTSPVSNAKILEETLITVENKKRYSFVPDIFNVYFGDVESDLRTDGIRTLNGAKTQNWFRVGVTELEPINNIVAKELLSQYQDNFRIFEGDILGNNINVRSIFNLPAYNLFKFVCLSFNIDIVNCIANVTIAQVYAQDGINGGATGGGSGSGGGNQIPVPDLVLGYNDLQILSDNNNNIFKVG